MLKKAINAWSFPAGMTYVEMLEMAKKAGYEGFEPAFNMTGECSMESPDSYFTDLKKKAAEIGVPLTSLASGLYWDYNFTANDPAVREKAKEICKAQLRAASLLGVDTILVVPGCVTGDVDYTVAYGRAQEALNELKAVAQQYGVVIGIENVWNKFLISPLEMARFLDEIGSDWVKAYFDIGNVILFGYPQHWIRALGKRIAKCHIKDFRQECSGKNFSGFVDLLSGDVDFPEVTKALKEVGYDGYVIAEMPGYSCYKDQIVYNTSAAMTRILGEK